MPSKTFKVMFFSIFAIVITIIILQFAAIFWVGSKAVEAVDDNNGSVAKTAGSFYKDFKEAAGE